MPRLASLQSAATLSDLARLLRFEPSGLSYILYRKPAAKKYSTFEIPKRHGGTRTITAPDDDLKLVQQRLSDLLQDCVDEINTAKNRKDKLAHGFKRKRSIITNARQHRKRRWVFNLDLEDFFPCINFGRVRGFFLRDHNFQLQKHVATTIAQIACHANGLPQGSPCSPVISNLIAHVMDMHLVRLSSKVGCTYSRYADDLTFSTNKKEFPPEIAKPSATDPHLWLPGPDVQALVNHAGFRINNSKTRMNYRTSRQDVTGLVVNEKINVRHDYRHNVRAMVHRLFSTGEFELWGIIDKGGTKTLEKRPGSLDELHGRLGFIDSIDQFNKKIASDVNYTRYPAGRESMYRQFLIYRDFYAASKPVILCEGETDNVYLTHAIRSLAASFPELAEIDSNGKRHLKVRIYKYARSSTARILGLKDGGTGHLKHFIGTYSRETDRFKAPGLKQPVIVLYDNDNGANPIRSAIREVSKKAVKATDAYTHVVRNLYAVPTPLLNNAKESKIEDFFDAAIKATVIGGKTFVAANDYDSTKHYGKKIFAHQVVRPKADTINFKGFGPLLTNIARIVKDHAAVVGATAP
ncbi:MAG: RNA-directed DNA polymerase [Bryobacterales bacterium]|nr:RNA-directed DNA polymerase [Bryobacterales bacterium]